MIIFPLEQGERRLLMVVSVSMCTGAILLAPLAARSSVDVNASEELAARELRAPSFDESRTATGLFLVRDPFAADVQPDQERSTGAEMPSVPSSDSAVGTQVQSGALISGILPANQGADGTPLLTSGASTISAVITGDKAQVLATVGGRSQILSVGDRLDGRTIVQITADGVRFADGSVRGVSDGRP